MNKEISIIIPVYNDPCGLKDTISSLMNLDYPKEKYEILIVDNGSKDGTFEIAKGFETAYPGLIKALKENTVRTSYAARNKGIKIANGELLFFLDSDMSVDRDYLKRIVDYFSCNDADYAGCQVKLFMKKENVFEKFDVLLGFPVKEHMESEHYTPTCCLTVKRQILDKTGCFDNRLESGGDYEFGVRVFKAGFVQKYIDNVTVFHPARCSYLSFRSRAKRIARGVAQMNYYYPEMFGGYYAKHLNVKSINIISPWKAMSLGKRSGVNINFFEAFQIFIIDMALRFERFFELLKETNRYNSLQKENT